MEPPITKYKYTLTIRGNSHKEILNELQLQLNGGYMLDSMYEERDEFNVTSGVSTAILEHTNPNMTKEKYLQDLTAWHKAYKQEKD